MDIFMFCILRLSVEVIIVTVVIRKQIYIIQSHKSISNLLINKTLTFYIFAFIDL